MRRFASLLALLVLSAIPAFSQQQEGGERRLPLGESVVGKVTAVAKDSVTVTPLTGGDAVAVKVAENTRIFKERESANLTDIKVGDTIFSRGQLTGNTLTAAILVLVTPEMAERFRQEMGGGGFGGGGRAQFNPEDLGKKFIAGEVKAINETKLTIARPDGQTQEIQVDENTSFRKGRESITLADIHAGDFVRGPGELKESVFFAKELIVGRPRNIEPPKAGDPK